MRGKTLALFDFLVFYSKTQNSHNMMNSPIRNKMNLFVSHLYFGHKLKLNSIASIQKAHFHADFRDEILL